MATGGWSLDSRPLLLMLSDDDDACSCASVSAEEVV